MQRQIRRVGMGLVVAFLLVFAQLNYLQIFAAERIASNPSNFRNLQREYSIKRGDIVTIDDVVIATSRPSRGQLEFRRSYPTGELFGHISGFYSIVFGTSGIERTYNDALLGDSGVISMQDIQDSLFGGGEQGDIVSLTIDSRLQELARSSLGSQRGAIIALDPNTGEIRAMWSNPSYDPTPLASHVPDDQRAAREALDPESSRSSLINIATQTGYPPGSTFKVVTAAAALESGQFSPNSAFPDPQSIDLPQTDNTLTNFSKTSCQGGGQIDLFTALEISCDTTFALIGLDIHREIFDMAEALGFNTRIPVDLEANAATYPQEGEDRQPFRAFAAIGQGDVVATPLQMALVAATVANNGDVPRPHLLREIIDPSGGLVQRFQPETLASAMSTSTASTLTDMMEAVVESGTGTTAQIEGVRVAGKTGTAQNVAGVAPHAWFIAFAPADDPQIAVAVIVENGGSVGSEATGAQVAAPIAREIIVRDKEIRRW